MSDKIKSITEAQAKKIWEFQEQFGKTQTVTYSPIPGLEVKVEYQNLFAVNDGGNLSSEVSEHTVKVSKELKPLEKFFGMSMADLIEYNIDEDFLIPDAEVAKINKDFKKAVSVLDKKTFKGFHFEYLSDYRTFAAFWADIKRGEKFATAPAPVTVKLNGSYSAIVRQGDDNVKVGCQTIPISKIKEILKAVEEVNAE